MVISHFLECCPSVIIASDASAASSMTGKYVKHSLDSSGRIVFVRENGDYFLYGNANNHWIVSLKKL